MTETEAIHLVGTLIAATSGWDDASTALFIDELAPLEIEPARAAILRIVRTWTRPGHPSLGVVHTEYRLEVERLRALRPQLRHHTEPTPPERGMLLAWRAYVDACRAEGREPNRDLFGSVIGRVIDK